MLTAYVQSFDVADRIMVRHAMTFLVGARRGGRAAPNRAPCGRPVGRSDRHRALSADGLSLRQPVLHPDRRSFSRGHDLGAHRRGNARACRFRLEMPCARAEKSFRNFAETRGVGGMASSSSRQTSCLRRDHIGGVTPSRPTRHARPCSVPSGCLIAAMNTFAPGLRSLLSPCT